MQFSVFTVDGRHVQRLANGWYGAGDHSVRWQRRGDAGAKLASGTYIVRLTGDGIARTQKLILLP